MEKIVRLIISFVLLGISLVGVLALVWPKYQEFSMVRAQLEARRDRLDRGEEALVRLRAMEARVEERKEDFAKIAQAVPRDVALPALYDHVQGLAVSSGLSLQSITGVEQAAFEEELTPLVFQTELVGSYEGLKQFLRVAQRSPRLINVRSLDVASSRQEGAALQITIELIAYARP